MQQTASKGSAPSLRMLKRRSGAASKLAFVEREGALDEVRALRSRVPL